ncbi:Ribonucleases P/MRP protein subunit pop1 [Coniosporium apollinis]|uniref:Ribonucleases P/MRP protein subunit pop1 n=1 Tax=Coniosporium apollinis TaxID=61459 RepID=A0ABQ9NQD8_9PEZI|nr:Ribonucleases P/MRP protein subunit pop1 [Coniosporium apollinis]
MAKRKQAPTPGNSQGQQKRQKTRDARSIAVQSSDKAFNNGELDLSSFVKAREFEIQALENGLKRSKKSLSSRAFQEVPRDLRRRTASHNAKRVPKRLQRRAKKEMAEDNTPTVTAKSRKKTGHMRLRDETARRLQKLSSRVKAKKNAVQEGAVTVTKDPPKDGDKDSAVGEGANAQKPAPIKPRKPRVKQNALKKPPTPPAKFRKRQIHKTWLPTHMFLTKRAHMTPPKEPLWRFAIPLTPTMKGYRPTHRASTQRGAVAWDMSYMSTIGLEGPEKSIEGLLKAVGLGGGDHAQDVWGTRGQKWKSGVRAWEGWLSEQRSSASKAIAPATVIWCPLERQAENMEMTTPNVPAMSEDKTKARRKALIRVHPAGFLQLWKTIIRLAKVQKPHVNVEDLRFEIGSIEITGPGLTEALVGALWPTRLGPDRKHPLDSPPGLWPLLGSVTNPASLPKDVVLGFNISDPRLHHPPITVPLLQDPKSHNDLLGILADWPLDRTQPPPALFDRSCRLSASRALPSQKSINRRKTDAVPGQLPEPRPTDPDIPVLLYTSRGASGSQATWTVLLPWKCVQPVWYSLMYYPLSTGGNVRFGGLREKRQIAFEAGAPWFPGDYPGTMAGWEWEVSERQKRKEEWARRPKGKRIEWTSVDLGYGRKGEIGAGWACDWQRLVDGPPAEGAKPATETANAAGALATVKLTLITRGVPTTCARIYRLPKSDLGLRDKWLSLLPRPRAKTGQKAEKQKRLPPLPKDTPDHVRVARLAESLLKPEPIQLGHPEYPIVPNEEDLIGFVTTGNFNLGEGRATGIGCLLLEKVISPTAGSEQEQPADGTGPESGEVLQKREDERTLCIIREAGQSIGRLARWEIV